MAKNERWGFFGFAIGLTIYIIIFVVAYAATASVFFYQILYNILPFPWGDIVPYLIPIAIGLICFLVPRKKESAISSH